MAEELKLSQDDIQGRFKQLIGLSHIRKKLDAHIAVKFLFEDIAHKNKRSDIKKIGWADPKDIPFYPEGTAFRAPIAATFNFEQIKSGETAIEYDFIEAYPSLAKTYSLPYNKVLSHVKYDTEKVLNRLESYNGKPTPYKNLASFSFFQVDIRGKKKPGTYAGAGTRGHLHYGDELYESDIWLTEIELKLIFDYYEVEKFEVKDSWTFKCKKDLLKDFFDRIEPLRYERGFETVYKKLRNKVIGVVGQRKLRVNEAPSTNAPIYNRAYQAMIIGVFRDRMARYEQEYVNSEYGLWQVKIDGLYFKKEVPLFEKLVKAGYVRKRFHVITDEEERKAQRRIEAGMR